MLTADVSAQIQMPSDSGPPSVTPTAIPQAMPQPTLVSAQQLLAGVRTALIKKDYHTAVQSYRRVTAMSGNLPQIADEVGKLRAQLLAIGIDGALLSLPPKSPAQPLSGVANAQPLGGTPSAGANFANRKQEALRLVAIGRASLDRGDIPTAVANARQAEALNVPEKDFAPGEPRVWQLLLDAESAARRSGVRLASGSEPLANQAATSGPGVNPVQAALAMAGADEGGNVAQAPFNAQPQNNGTLPANTNIQPVQAIAPIAGQQAGKPNAAQINLAEGLDALGRGDTAVARAKFREAWKQESDLTLAERNQLKDKLTLLQPKRITPQTSTPPEDMTAIQRAELAEQDRTRRLFREVTAELAKAEQIKETAPLDALDELERLRRRVDGSELSDQGKRSMAMMVDRAIGDQKQFIQANRAKIDLELQNDAVRAEMATEQAKNLVIDEEVSVLVRSFNELIKDRRYQEAEIIAKQVQELKPDDPIAVSMFHTSRMGTRLMIDQEVRDRKELAFLDTMIDVDRSAVAIDPQLPLTMPDARDWEALSRVRLQDANNGESRLSQAEQEIQRKLITEVSIKYANRPLGEVIDELSAVTGVPMVLDMRALNAVRVTTDTPVTLQLPGSIKLKSALNLILNSLELTYVIENDVLSITSLEAKRSKVYPRTYRVTDLVTPIPNFSSSYEDGLAGALRAAYQMTNPQANVQVMPVSMTDLGNGMAGGAAGMNSNVLGQYNPMGSQGGFGMNNPPMGGAAAGGGSFADFQSLMDLIQTTIAPDTWEALGGPSSMSPYPQNLSLVISTTSEVHDQIADLLESLRRLQNLQITIEVRFITLSDTFAEQIGVDFQVSFQDNVQTLPEGKNGGPSVVIGWDGINKLPAPGLDITLNNTSFGLQPPFGAETVANASTIGFAILSDIEAFFFLQAAQADNRNNVMQAPKVTLFDGQLATISDQTQVPFVTSITPVVGDFAVAQQPVIVVLNEGTQLNVQGIVSNDKRFVRLTLVPFFSQIGKVNTFTYEGRRTTQSASRQEADTNNDGTINESDEQETEDVIEGSTVQLPQFAFTTVSTTVSVPDGGTILLGGIKRLREGRTERGIPVLGKIPYLSRLFRNVSTGREAQSLMLMVTPRIIIQEEEEVRQTGFNPDQQ